MGLTLAQGRYIHIVAPVNLSNGTGKILYVNPSAVALEDKGDREYDVELQFYDAAGNLLSQHKPQVTLNSCQDGTSSRTGLIQTDIPYQEGMKEIALLINGQVQSRYVAGNIDQAAGAEIAMEAPQPQSPNRRTIAASPEMAQTGLTYTVQARPAGDAVWQTIAVGRALPDVEVNMNQFPSAEVVSVRVLVTNGFEESVLTEQQLTADNS